MYILQGNKLASGILFAVLLNFKHIYMYLAVRNDWQMYLLLFNLFFSTASVFYISPSIFLYVVNRGNTCQEFSLFGECSYRRICGIPRTLRAHGPDPPSPVKVVSLHAWFKSCILGSEFLGFGYCC